MPISISTYFLPGSRFVPYLVEDKFIKGGYTVFKTLTDRDDWTTNSKDTFGRFNIEEIDPRKQGSLCYVMETDLIYKMAEDLETWDELKFGAEYETEAPLEVIGNNRLSIDSTRILPPPGTAGQTIALDSNRIPRWVNSVSNVGTRSSFDYTMDTALESGESHNFAVPDVAASIMILELEVNAIGLKVEGFTSAERIDRNPFTFVSAVGLTVDQGIRIGDDLEETFFRRFSFMSNLEDPVVRTLYFKFTNEDDAPMTPTMTLTYVVIE
jgi:hypothetical protein